MLTLAELQMLSGLLDLGIKAAGLAAFQNGGGAKLDGIIAKLEVMAQEASKSAEKTKEPA